MRDHDVRGAGGNIGRGLRTVRKGGRLKFDGSWHADPALLPLVGQRVEVSAEDAFFNVKVMVKSLGDKFVCYARNEYDGVSSRQEGKS